MHAVKTLSALVALSIPALSSAAPIFYDFGDSAQISANNYNNVIVNPPGTLSILNSIDSTGAGTGVTLAASGFFNGSNQNGPTVPTGAAAIFDPQATRDNAFGHAAAFGVNPLTPVGTILLGGLNPSQAYDFAFFGSRTGVTDNRETEYNVTGVNNGVAFLNTSANTSNIAEVFGINPNANGEITILVDPGPNNNNASLFYYIGAMRVNAVPEPVSAAVLLLGGAMVARRRRA